MTGLDELCGLDPAHPAEVGQLHPRRRDARSGSPLLELDWSESPRAMVWGARGEESLSLGGSSRQMLIGLPAFPPFGMLRQKVVKSRVPTAPLTRTINGCGAAGAIGWPPPLRSGIRHKRLAVAPCEKESEGELQTPHLSPRNRERLHRHFAFGVRVSKIKFVCLISILPRLG